VRFEVDRFRYVRPGEPEVTGDPISERTVVPVDPWGRPYRYFYKLTAGWSNPSCVLYSCGADGLDDPALVAGGYPDRNSAPNADNIFAP
jgi:hypothetical protein